MLLTRQPPAIKRTATRKGNGNEQERLPRLSVGEIQGRLLRKANSAAPNRAAFFIPHPLNTAHSHQSINGGLRGNSGDNLKRENMRQPDVPVRRAIVSQHVYGDPPKPYPIKNSDYWALNWGYGGMVGSQAACENAAKEISANWPKHKRFRKTFLMKVREQIYSFCCATNSVLPRIKFDQFVSYKWGALGECLGRNGYKRRIRIYIGRPATFWYGPVYRPSRIVFERMWKSPY